MLLRVFALQSEELICLLALGRKGGIDVLEKLIGLKLRDCVVAIQMKASSDLNRAGVGGLRPNVFDGARGKTVKVCQASRNGINEKGLFAS